MKRQLLTVVGSVQGVGFRPFLYRLASRFHLVGSVRNTTSGVHIDVQGDEESLHSFREAFLQEKPERARILSLHVREAPLHEALLFEIKESESHAETALALLPDTALCSQCIRELKDTSNRRYGYPFIHCTSCGPRFSLFLRMPFDRVNTTMIDFPMCGECRKEYEDPSDRRFYSQTTCCPHCGPTLRVYDRFQREVASHEDAISAACEYLERGKIVAMKNTGGYLLLADGTNEETIQRLRLLKKRSRKPFALLVPDILTARRIAMLPQTAESILASPAAPIVLLPKNSASHDIAPSVASYSPYYGLMLAHTALHYLMLEHLKRPLVATSGNRSGSPIALTEEEAFSELGAITDFFLVHNRRIIHRLDDSLVQIVGERPVILRRARGYIPHALSFSIPSPSSSSVLSVGGHMKNSFALMQKNSVYLSQHMGDLETSEGEMAYEKEVKSWEVLLNTTPSYGVGDSHPAYFTTFYLEKRALPKTFIQHHRAHVFSCMADNTLSPPLLGFAWDGTGWGDDQTIWGGETFLVREGEMQRFASLYPFRLPGSEKAVLEPRRSALGLLYALFGDRFPASLDSWVDGAFLPEERSLLLHSMNKNRNAPLCSSMGRLFDAVSALLDCVLRNHFEGEAALSFEAEAMKAHSFPTYTMPLIKEGDLFLIDWRPAILQMLADKKNRVSTPEIALGFHQSLVDTMIRIAHAASLEKVVLTGGVMQNMVLLNAALTQLKEAGFTPFWHHHIPPNDGGIAVGQMLGAVYEWRASQGE